MTQSFVGTIFAYFSTMKSKWMAIVIVPMVAAFSCNGGKDDKNEAGNVNDSTGDTNGSNKSLSFDSKSVQGQGS